MSARLSCCMLCGHECRGDCLQFLQFCGVLDHYTAVVTNSTPFCFFVSHLSFVCPPKQNLFPRSVRWILWGDVWEAAFPDFLPSVLVQSLCGAIGFFLELLSSIQSCLCGEMSVLHRLSPRVRWILLGDVWEVAFPDFLPPCSLFVLSLCVVRKLSPWVSVLCSCSVFCLLFPSCVESWWVLKAISSLVKMSVLSWFPSHQKP